MPTLLIAPPPTPSPDSLPLPPGHSPHLARCAIWLFLLCSGWAGAAETPSAAPAQPPHLAAARTAGTIEVDGELGEADWLRAEPAAGFLQVEPDGGAPASEATEVRILFDDHSLFLGIRCHDQAGARSTRVPDLRRDFDAAQHDYLSVVLDPFGDGRTAQAFEINPWGAQRDLQVTDGSETDVDWDAAWSVRTRRGDDGWTAEIAIPWSTLRYPAGAASWRLQLARQVRRKAEVSAWSPWPRGLSPYRTTYAGVLDGLEPPPPSRQLRFQPYALARASRTEGPGGERSSEELEAGGEIKWLPGTATVLDATFNTDFAQTEADRQVINLSRFSVLFPEKRSFFLESAGLFDSGFDDLKPFFSRRIGLDGAGNPVPLDVGLRLVRQDAERRWGGLLARTGGAGQTPASTFAVGRWSENLGERHRLGAQLVSRHDEAGAARAARSNTVLALDGLYRPSELFTVQGFLSASTTTGTGGEGIAGSLWAYTRGPRGYLGWVQQVVSDGYQAEAGFVSRSNLIVTSPAGTLDWRPDWLPRSVRQLKPNFVSYLYHSWDRQDFQEGWLRLEPLWVVFQDGSEVWAWWEPTAQRLDVAFSPLPGLEVTPGDYDFERWGIAGATDRSHPWGLEVRHTTGGFFDGRLDSTQATARLRPSPRLSLVVDYRRDEIRDLGPERRRRTTELIAPELRLAWSTRLQLTAFYQRNTATELASWYTRLAWELAPLSYVYVVYGDLEPTDPGRGSLARPGTRDRQLVVKLTYLWQR